MPASIDFSSFTAIERSDLLKAAKAELLRRAGIGSVETGSATGQSFGMRKMSDDALTALINSLTKAAGYAGSDGGQRVRPNFSCRG